MRPVSLLFLNLALLSLLNFACSKELPELPANDLIDDPSYRPIHITHIENISIGQVRVYYQIDYDYSKRPDIIGVRLLKSGELSGGIIDLDKTSITSGVNMNRTYCFNLALTDGTWYSNWSYEVCIDT